MSQPPSAPPIPFVYGKRAEDIAVLSQCPLFARLDLKEMGILLDWLDHVTVPEGSVVLMQEQAGDQLYVILEGEAQAQQGEGEPSIKLPGDHFGELSLFGQPSAVTVTAQSPLRLARLARSRFQALADRHPALGVHLLQSLAQSMSERLAKQGEGPSPLLRTRTLSRKTQARARMNGEVRTLASGTPVREVLPEQVESAKVVAALVDSKPVSLKTPLVSDAVVAPLSLKNWEGREVYRRSVGLLLLEAAHRIAPRLRIRLGPSVGVARVVVFDRDAVDASFPERLAREMHALVRQNLPFREELWTVEEARVELIEQGCRDAAILLSTYREPMITLTSCGRLYSLHMGPMLPTTGEVRDFSLLPHPEGLLLDFGPPISAEVPGPAQGSDPLAQEQATPRFGGEMAEAHRKWLRAVSIESVGALTERCIGGKVGELIRIAEGFHEKRIAKIADGIVARKDAIRVIGIAGPSSSGKTTFIKRLSVHLEIEGIHPVNISLDDYYKDRERLVPDEKGEYDFEAPSAFDIPLLRSHIERLLRGEAVKTARFDFVTKKSFPEGGPELRVGPNDVLLIEGIHGLNPALLEGILPREQAFLVFIHPATTLAFDPLTSMASSDLRLLRRIVRDRHHRNYTAADNIQRWASVRRGEAMHIYPLLPHADEVFDSSLVYEPSVLKVYAERYLLEVPPRHPAFPTAYRLRHLIDRFVAIYPDHVPPTSIAREFIGGSGFEY